MDSSSSNPNAPGSPGGSTPPEPVSPATERFLACRWRKAAENGTPDHCTHRDVLPMAGITGFAPDAWCADCQFFKAKRTPRKKQEEPTERWRW